MKGNQRWDHPDIICFSCKRNTDETRFHLLNFEKLLGKNKFSHMPDYKELYHSNLSGQVCVLRILKETSRESQNAAQQKSLRLSIC